MESNWNEKVVPASQRGGLAPAEWVQAALAIVMLLLALYGLLQMPVSSGAETAAPTTMVQSTQVAHAIDGSMASSCRTVRWCSKPGRKGFNSMVQVEQSTARIDL